MLWSKPKKPINYCCEKLKESYEQGLIKYAYEDDVKISESDWLIDGFGYLYYCPFCGAFIKGRGFGDYDKKYPPKKYTQVLRQIK